MSVGIGYDVHRLVGGRRLVLGGVEIEFAQGLLGHSDADVLLHAVCDALLGAAALGDIGMHFPDDDPAYENISSLVLLDRVWKKVQAAGFEMVNLDAIIIAQKPKMVPYVPQMRQNIAQVLGVPVERVGLKATTTEGLGYIGQSLGISAQAVAQLRQNKEE